MATIFGHPPPFVGCVRMGGVSHCAGTGFGRVQSCAQARVGHVRICTGTRVSYRPSRTRASRRMSASGGGCADDVTRDIGLVTRRVVVSSVGSACAATAALIGHKYGHCWLTFTEPVRIVGRVFLLFFSWHCAVFIARTCFLLHRTVSSSCVRLVADACVLSDVMQGLRHVTRRVECPCPCGRHCRCLCSAAAAVLLIFSTGPDYACGWVRFFFVHRVGPPCTSLSWARCWLRRRRVPPRHLSSGFTSSALSLLSLCSGSFGLLSS